MQQTLDKMPLDMLAMLTKLALFFSWSPLWPCLLGVLHAMNGERGATEDFIKAEIQDEKLDKLEAGMPAGGNVKVERWLKWRLERAPSGSQTGDALKRVIIRIVHAVVRVSKSYPHAPIKRESRYRPPLPRPHPPTTRYSSDRSRTW